MIPLSGQSDVEELVAEFFVDGVFEEDVPMMAEWFYFLSLLIF